MFAMVFECIKTKRQDYIEVMYNDEDDLAELKRMVKEAQKATSNDFGIKSQIYHRPSRLDNDNSFISVDIEDNHSPLDD